MSIFEYNGSALVAMVGKNCFAIASDRRLGVQLQTIATDFQRIFKIHDKLYVGLSGLATDVQTLYQRFAFRHKLYQLREERNMRPETFASLVSALLYEKRLDGKVAIITGGATGIGEAIVWLFAKHGARVIIADIAEEGGRKLAGSLSPPATYVRCDVSNEKDIRAAVDLAMEKYGQLDIMYNNAGTVESVTVDSVAEYEMEQFDRVMRVNVRGVMLGIKHAARVMIPRKKGCIISTASVAGVVAGMSTHAYTASKHAVIGLTKNGAAELGKYGIRVNAVSPYGVATALAVNYMKQGNASVVSEEDKAAMEAFCNSTANLEGATLKAEDIAEAGLYLASDEAKYVSGHNLVVDGGFSVVNHSWKLYR